MIPACAFSEDPPTGTRHTVCDVIIGAGTWLLRVNTTPAEAVLPIRPLGSQGLGVAPSVTYGLLPPAIVVHAAPPPRLCLQAKPLKTTTSPVDRASGTQVLLLALPVLTAA